MNVLSLSFPGVWVVDVLIAFTVVEAIALWGWHRSGRGGVAPGDMIPNMAAGLCLMVALRCALGGAGWGWIGLCLCASGMTHGWDLRRRWKHRSGPAAAVLKSPGARTEDRSSANPLPVPEVPTP